VVIKRLAVKLFYLLLALSSGFLGANELPISNVAALGQKYLNKVRSSNKPFIAPLVESQLPLSINQALRNEFRDLYYLLVVEQPELATVFALVHKPFLKKRGLRKQYMQSIKSFEKQPDFVVLPFELQTRIKNFHAKAVVTRPRLSAGQKAALVLAAFAGVGVVGGYGLYKKSSTASVVATQNVDFSPLGLPANAPYIVNGRVDVEKLMPFVAPDEPNRFVINPDAYTWQSFDQKKMGKLWKHMPQILFDLLEQSFDDAQVLAQKKKKGSYTIEDPLVHNITQRLLAFGRICLYLEQVDRTYLRHRIFSNQLIFDTLLSVVRACPCSAEIFDKITDVDNGMLGLKRSRWYGLVRNIFSILSSPLIPNPYSLVFASLPQALPEGAAVKIRDKDPTIWVAGVKPYVLPPPQS